MLRSIILLSLLALPLAAESEDYYVNLALNHNARLNAERQLSAALESDHRRESTFNENPELMFGLMNVPVNTFPALNRDTMSNFSVGISQRIALPWESHYRKTAAEIRAATSGINLELQKASLRFEVLEKLNAVQYNAERGKNLAEAKKLVTVTMRLLATPRREQRNVAGQILEARAALATVENEILGNAYELEKSWIEIEALCGQKIIRESGSETDWEKVFTASQPVDTALMHGSLIYRKAESEMRAQQAMLSLSRAALFPEVKIQANYMFRQQVPGSSMGDDMVSLSASTPMPLFYPLKNKHEIEGQDKRLKAAEQMLIETERQLTAQVVAENARLKALNASIHNYAHAILPAHISAHRSHLANINLMGGNAAEALIAYRMYLSAGEERLKQIREAHSAIHRLQYLTAQEAK